MVVVEEGSGCIGREDVGLESENNSYCCMASSLDLLHIMINKSR
jgi:hypothetical protein